MINLEERHHTKGEVDSLRGGVSSMKTAYKKVIALYSGKDIFALTGTIRAIEDCEPEYTKKGFPVSSLEFIIRDLRQFLANLETHPIHQCRNDIEDLLAEWTKAQQKEQSHPKKVALNFLEYQTLAVVGH